jgi:hypothetical protein
LSFKHIDCIFVFGFILPSLVFFFLLQFLFVVHLALQVCYFCNSTQLQHLPPSPQETIQHDQIFHGTKLAVDEAPKEAMQKKICVDRSHCWYFGGCQLHCHLLEAPFVDLFLQESCYCGDEA